MLRTCYKYLWPSPLHSLSRQSMLPFRLKVSYGDIHKQVNKFSVNISLMKMKRFRNYIHCLFASQKVLEHRLHQKIEQHQMSVRQSHKHFCQLIQKLQKHSTI